MIFIKIIDTILCSCGTYHEITDECSCKQIKHEETTNEDSGLSLSDTKRKTRGYADRSIQRTSKNAKNSIKKKG